MIILSSKSSQWGPQIILKSYPLHLYSSELLAKCTCMVSSLSSSGTCRLQIEAPFLGGPQARAYVLWLYVNSVQLDLCGRFSNSTRAPTVGEPCNNKYIMYDVWQKHPVLWSGVTNTNAVEICKPFQNRRLCGHLWDATNI